MDGLRKPQNGTKPHRFNSFYLIVLYAFPKGISGKAFKRLQALLKKKPLRTSLNENKVAAAYILSTQAFKESLNKTFNTQRLAVLVM